MEGSSGNGGSGLGSWGQAERSGGADCAEHHFCHSVDLHYEVLFSGLATPRSSTVWHRSARFRSRIPERRVAEQALIHHLSDQKNPHNEHEKQLEQSHIKSPPSAAIKAGQSDAATKHFSPSEIKQWAMDDFAKTVSWLESQEEKPEPNELKAIASEGIITCLQDAIESLEQGNDISGVADQWSFVPHVVDELVQLDGGRKEGSLSKRQLTQLAIKCRDIYEAEFAHMDSGDKKGKKRQSSSPDIEHRRKTKPDDAQYDSDDTIEMTEEEIDLACRQLSGISG